MDLPSTVVRSLRMTGTTVAALNRERAAQALDLAGGRQRRWMPSHPDGYLNQAMAAVVEHRLVEGRALLEEALERDPMRPFTIRLSALLDLLEGRFDQALDVLAQAEAVAPGYRVPRIELTAEDEAEVVVNGLERRIEIYPRLRTQTLLTMAQRLRSRGDVEGAWTRIDQASGDPRVDLVRARWKLEEGAAAEAAGMAQAMAGSKQLPSSLKATAWSILAQALEVQGDSVGAEKAAARALRLAPDNPSPHLALAHLARTRGDLESALEHLRRAWGMDPANLSILFQFASTAEAVGRDADARLALERAMEIKPDTPSIAARLVDFQLRHGALMDATMTLSEALDRAPTDRELLRLAERLRASVAAR